MERRCCPGRTCVALSMSQVQMLISLQCFFLHATLALLLDRFCLHGCSSQGATVQKAGGNEGCALQAEGFHWCHFASDFVALTCEQLYAAGAKMRCRRQGLWQFVVRSMVRASASLKWTWSLQNLCNSDESASSIQKPRRIIGFSILSSPGWNWSQTAHVLESSTRAAQLGEQVVSSCVRLCWHLWFLSLVCSWKSIRAAAWQVQGYNMIQHDTTWYNMIQHDATPRLYMMIQFFFIPRCWGCHEYFFEGPEGDARQKHIICGIQQPQKGRPWMLYVVHGKTAAMRTFKFWSHFTFLDGGDANRKLSLGTHGTVWNWG